MTDTIQEWIGAQRERCIEALRDLVQMDTQNLAPLGNERSAQLAVGEMLRALDCAVDVYEVSSVPGLLEHPQYWAARPCTGRPNVMGIRHGTGGGRSLLFSSHMDTVPVGPDAWSKAPWGGEISAGKLWGLGAYDMKAGLMASVMTMKALRDLGIQLQGDVMVESVVDEEFGGCNGTLAARLKYNADLAIVPEPTNLIVCPAHQGGMMLKVTFRGKPGWSFSPEAPIDPTLAAAHCLDMLNAWNIDRQKRWTPPKSFQKNPVLPLLINQFKAGDTSLAFFADRIPSHAWLCVWVGVHPGTTREDVLDDVQAFYRQAQQNDPLLAAFEPEWTALRWQLGSEIAAGHAGVDTVAGVVSNVRGQETVIQGAPFACDGHMFNVYSPTPMLLVGPEGGNPHSPDEFVTIESYLQLIEIFIRAAIQWCGAA